MTGRQTPSTGKRALPRLWLMTDERMGEPDALLSAVRRLPKGSGVIFRHYSLSHNVRRELLAKLRPVAKRRRLLLSLAGPQSLARNWRADGWHARERLSGGSQRGMLRSAPVHNLREIRRAERSGAQLLFLSPLYPTRSHPGARPLGRVRFAHLARQTRLPIIALGGMTKRRARGLRRLGAHGWAAIDALSAR